MTWTLRLPLCVQRARTFVPVTSAHSSGVRCMCWWGVWGRLAQLLWCGHWAKRRVRHDLLLFFFQLCMSWWNLIFQCGCVFSICTLLILSKTWLMLILVQYMYMVLVSHHSARGSVNRWSLNSCWWLRIRPYQALSSSPILKFTACEVPLC